MRRVLQISGPPCSGKSTALRALAARGFVVLDDWEFHRGRGALSRAMVPDASWRAWYEALDREIASGSGDLAFIQGRPEPRAPGVEVVLLDPGREECHRRARADRRPPATHAWVDQWYAANVT